MVGGTVVEGQVSLAVHRILVARVPLIYSFFKSYFIPVDPAKFLARAGDHEAVTEEVIRSRSAATCHAGMIGAVGERQGHHPKDPPNGEANSRLRGVLAKRLDAAHEQGDRDRAAGKRAGGAAGHDLQAIAGNLPRRQVEDLLGLAQASEFRVKRDRHTSPRGSRAVSLTHGKARAARSWACSEMLRNHSSRFQGRQRLSRPSTNSVRCRTSRAVFTSLQYITI